MIPEEAVLEDPFSVQYLTVLELAPLMNRIVEVPAKVELLELMIDRLLLLPVALTRPSMVTLSAPFRSINGADDITPEMLKPVVVG